MPNTYELIKQVLLAAGYHLADTLHVDAVMGEPFDVLAMVTPSGQQVVIEVHTNESAYEAFDWTFVEQWISNLQPGDE